MASTVPTNPALRRAVGTRNAKSLNVMLAAHAAVTIIDTGNPPSQPRSGETCLNSSA
jgi:hypothetical protein